MDKECSQNLQRSIKKNKLDYQLVPPNHHQQNAAECAIHTFKNHLRPNLVTCSPKCPIYEWDQLLSQAELTLNILRTSRVNPALSAHAYLNGVHDFNKISLAPPGTQSIVHAKPDKCASWTFHDENGWYVGPAPHHYRYFKCFMPATHKERISDKVQFIPSKIPIPSVTLVGHIAMAAETLVSTLHHYSISLLPDIKLGDLVI